ncbi:MAG: arginine--tRNA ligase [Bacilli bacterium]
MIIKILEEIINKVFKENGYMEQISIIKSNRSDLGDYQCNDIFKIAKLYHKNPLEIGEEIVAKINNLTFFKDYFKEVTFIKPGFINIIISDNLINELLNKMLKDDHFNLEKVTKKELYFLDYGGPNIAKPLHVGHLRTAIIGEAIKRIIKFKGHDVISDVHLGDYGLQIGEVIYGLLNDKVTDITLDYLTEIYPKMNKLCKEDDNVLKACSQITKELQEGNITYQNLWKKICEVSIKDIKRMYNYLGVSFDLWQGESDSYKYIEPLTKILEAKNLLKESENAKIIEVKLATDTKEMPPLIYQKSNGAYLYGTTDLATIYERFTKYHPDHILYVVDARQSLHFEQVFRVCSKCGIDINLEHLGYGTVNGSDGKPFKTRSGDTIKLDDLFKQVKEIFINTKATNKDMNNQDLDIIVNAIIKFADLQNNREKDYIFDPLKFSNVVGKTGPYILYTYLRINKILKSENLTIEQLNTTIYNNNDRDLRIKLLELSLSIDSAFKEKRPNYIAEYIYDICVLNNIFYQTNHINNLEDLAKKQQWLLLLTLSNKLLKELLNLLMIEIPSQM